MANSGWKTAVISDRFAITTLVNLSAGERVEINPVTLPIHSPHPCQGSIDAIDRLRERVKGLEGQMSGANRQERTLLQKRIKTVNQQIKTEEEALDRCRGGK